MVNGVDERPMSVTVARSDQEGEGGEPLTDTRDAAMSSVLTVFLFVFFVISALYGPLPAPPQAVAIFVFGYVMVFASMYPFMRWSLRRQCIPRWRFPILFESRFLVVFVPVFGLILDVPALIESAVALYCCISMAGACIDGVCLARVAHCRRCSLGCALKMTAMFVFSRSSARLPADAGGTRG